MIILTLLIVVLSIEKVQNLKEEPIKIIEQALKGIFNYSNIPDTIGPILQCIDNDSSLQIVEFITSSLSKGAKGSASDINTLIDDLHIFQANLPRNVKLCLYQNQELLKLSYKYGIGYRPLAESIFKNYTRTNYLKLHSMFVDVNSVWTNKKYQDAGYSFAKYAQIIYPVKKKKIRAVWLTNVASQALSNRQNIQQAVRLCSKAHINTIFVVVYNNARTIYPSSVMENLIGIKQQEKYIGRDPLQQVIEIAHTLNIQVHAWFQYGFSSSYSAQGGPIIARKPNWKALDSNGSLVVKNGFDWLNGFDPQVQDFMISLFKQVIMNYEIDGVQGDDRLPALPSTAGYEPYTISLYKSDHEGMQPPKDYKDKKWIDWRVNKLNQFMKKLYLQVKQARQTIYLSVSPSPYPWSVQEYLQDWPTWVKYNWVDAVIPQCYRYNFEGYKGVLTQQLGYNINQKISFASGILLNIGDYIANTTFLSEMVELNRQLNIQGDSFFYFEGIAKQKDWFINNYDQVISTK